MAKVRIKGSRHRSVRHASLGDIRSHGVRISKADEARVKNTFYHMMNYSSSRNPEREVKSQMIRHTADYTKDPTLPTYGMNPRVVRAVLRKRVGKYPSL